MSLLGVVSPVKSDVTAVIWMVDMFDVMMSGIVGASSAGYVAESKLNLLHSLLDKAGIVSPWMTKISS